MTFRAIIAPYDKTGAVELARGLIKLGWEIYSTSGSQRHLTEAGLAVHSISELTGFPEILDGRVKTLHPAVHGGLLARRDVPEHMRQLEEHGLSGIDLVAGNLYPFVETVSKPDVQLQDALEQIDIGGLTMLRAAAKNFPHVLPLVDPADYPAVLEGLRFRGCTPRGAPAAGREGVPARRHLRHGHRRVSARRPDWPARGCHHCAPKAFRSSIWRKPAPARCLLR